MKKLIFLLFTIMTLCAQAQFSVGTEILTLYDESRNRNIPIQIHFPVTAGTTVPADGNFPVVTIGHGFLMGINAYENFWMTLVPLGYIVILPDTETGFAPSHETFGLDLAFSNQEILNMKNTPGSLLENSVGLSSCVMGHSMGGGAGVLAAANSGITTYVGFAPAETNPSAIAAAANVDKPTLIFSGSGDAVTPPIDHHLPIYNAINSGCKYLISIHGGAHCYFAGENLACDFGESTSGGVITISREEQQEIVADYLIPWLNYFLKDEDNAWDTYTSLLYDDPRVAYNESCDQLTNNSVVPVKEITLFPNPVSDKIFLDNLENDFNQYEVIDFNGKTVQNGILNKDQNEINISLENGIYYIRFFSKNKIYHTKFIVLK